MKFLNFFEIVDFLIEIIFLPLFLKTSSKKPNNLLHLNKLRLNISYFVILL